MKKMKKYDSLLIGHISWDEDFEYSGKHIVSIGGAVSYSSATAAAGGYAIGVLTKTAAEDREKLCGNLRVPQEDITWYPSAKSSKFYNHFLSEDKERRNTVAASVADPFHISDLPEAEAKLYYLAGLVNGDFDLDLYPELSRRGKLAMDVQGVLRCTDGKDEDGNIRLTYKDWEFKKKYFPYIDFLKLDAREAELMTGKSDTAEAARVLADWGAKEILITHNTQVLAFDGSEFVTCPLKPRSLTGRSGRGDSTFGGYTVERLYHSMEDSVYYAAALVSLKMEVYGPFKGTREDVLAYQEEFFRRDELKVWKA